jgi:DNA-binding NarL/FixJ family response regulator
MYTKDCTMKNQDSSPIGVFIVSDSHIMRSGLQRILESQAGIRVLGDFGFEKAAVAETLLGQPPELVLFDLDPRGNDVLGIIGALQKTFKDSAVLVLSDLADHELTRKALALGAAGVVLKIQPPAVLVAAIQDLCPRYRYESIPKSRPAETKQRTPRTVLKACPADTEEMGKTGSLTAREREIIRLIGLGLRNKDIANRLSISDITVRHHLTSIFCKLEVEDRQKLLILAHRYGLAELTLHAEPA